MIEIQHHILQKQQTYDGQMASIQKIVSSFAEKNGWKKIYRGRHAHASIAGDVNSIIGVIDIQMWMDDWCMLPKKLPDSYPFEVFAGGSTQKNEKILAPQEEFYKIIPFRELSHNVSQLLEDMWHFFKTIKSR